VKLAVVTLTIGDLYQRIAEISHPSLRRYAEKVGADFIVWTDKGDHEIPGYAKLDLFQSLLKTYDRVLYVDTDILIRFDAPNLFDLVPETHVGAYDEGTIYPRAQAKELYGHEVKTLLARDFVESPVYFNTGVLLASRCHKGLFAKCPFPEVNNFAEQTFLNYRLFDRGTPVYRLPYKCNRIHQVTFRTGENFADCYFLHFAGAFGTDRARQATEGATFAEFSRLAALFDSYRAAGEVPYLPKQVYVEMNGGLGDQVASEPLIRYFAEVLYPRDKLVVCCGFPEILAHLPSITVLPKGQMIPDTGFFRVKLMPELNRYPSFNLCHPLDYVSVKAIEGQLYNEHRRIKLVSDAKLSHDLSRHVAIHPGRGWPSKTFPGDWWNEVLARLHFHYIPVVLIGNNTVDVNPERCLDLRGKTTLAELIKVIEQAPCLVTNDSSPVHIAGAFDNPAVLIASCKHPDHIFPHRDPALNIALGRPIKTVFPPTYLGDPIMLDECTPEELQAVLPSPKDVAQATIKAYKQRMGELGRGHAYARTN
jgi:hypothetical protein